MFPESLRPRPSEQVVGRGLRLMFPQRDNETIWQLKTESLDDIRRNKLPASSFDCLFIVVRKVLPTIARARISDFCWGFIKGKANRRHCSNRRNPSEARRVRYILASSDIRTRSDP